MSLERAVEALKRGELVIYPTDTLFALGARAADRKAVARVFAAKRRPRDQPVPVAVATPGMLERVAKVTPLARRLYAHFLPGPLTLVLDRGAASDGLVARNVTAGHRDIAVRVPAHPVALSLIREVGAVVVTSANRHGGRDPVVLSETKPVRRAAKVALDSDRPLLGEPSTIVDARGTRPRVLRKGVISDAAIRAALEASRHG